MKILLSSRGLFALGFVLLIATNAIVLSGVAANRSGEPESRIILTERELQMPGKVHEENSGLALQLTWRTLPGTKDENDYYNERTPGWLGADKLTELGFALDDKPSLTGETTYQRQPISREVFIVLEYDGEPYREAVHRAEMALEKEQKALALNPGGESLRRKVEWAEERVQRERTEETRLFAIDAGLDADRLREKYGDRTRYIITTGLVRPLYLSTESRDAVAGYISRLSVSSIHVPLNLRRTLPSRSNSPKSIGAPRYQVNLAFGKRLEPWILSVQEIRMRN
jgi:hypothetical protein